MVITNPGLPKSNRVPMAPEKKLVEPSPVKEEPVIVPKKEVKRKKSLLEEMLEDKDE